MAPKLRRVGIREGKHRGGGRSGRNGHEQGAWVHSGMVYDPMPTVGRTSTEHRGAGGTDGTDHPLASDDQRTVQGLLDGDPESVAEARRWIRHAFFPYRDRLQSDLEDLEQDALMALIEAVRSGRYEAQSKLKTFARAIGHHKCLDKLRAASRRQWVDVEDMGLIDEGRDPMASLEADESRRLALRALEETGEACRGLWAMLSEGMDQRGMAERLGIQEGTLRARLYRCRQKALAARDQLLDRGRED